MREGERGENLVIRREGGRLDANERDESEEGEREREEKDREACPSNNGSIQLRHWETKAPRVQPQI